MLNPWGRGGGGWSERQYQMSTAKKQLPSNSKTLHILRDHMYLLFADENLG